MISSRPLRALLAVSGADGLALHDDGRVLLAWRTGETRPLTVPPSSRETLVALLQAAPASAPRFEVIAGGRSLVALVPPDEAREPVRSPLPGLGDRRLSASIAGRELVLVEGDIADQETDAVVNAAHRDLGGGTGVDGAIHLRGGPDISRQCRALGGCAPGSAVITTGGALRARFVIHAVGPEHDPYADQSPLLASAYRESLRLAERHALESVAFPAISTGAFCFPMAKAAPVALRTIIEFLKVEARSVRHVRLVLYPREDRRAFAIHRDALRSLL